MKIPTSVTCVQNAAGLSCVSHNYIIAPQGRGRVGTGAARARARPQVRCVRAARPC